MIAPSLIMTAVTQCNFSSDFQSPCSGKLIGVDCWGGNMIRFTTDFPLIKPIQYFLCVGKVNVTSRFHQRVDWKSADIRFSINFQTLLSTLDLSVVTQYNFSWKWIGWENRMENQMKNNTVTASQHDYISKALSLV